MTPDDRRTVLDHRNQLGCSFGDVRTPLTQRTPAMQDEVVRSCCGDCRQGSAAGGSHPDYQRDDVAMGCHSDGGGSRHADCRDGEVMNCPGDGSRHPVAGGRCPSCRRSAGVPRMVKMEESWCNVVPWGLENGGDDARAGLSRAERRLPHSGGEKTVLVNAGSA